MNSRSHTHLYNDDNPFNEHFKSVSFKDARYRNSLPKAANSSNLSVKDLDAVTTQVLARLQTKLGASSTQSILLITDSESQIATGSQPEARSPPSTRSNTTECTKLEEPKLSVAVSLVLMVVVTVVSENCGI